MYNDDEIDTLRRQLDRLTGRARLPLVIQLAQRLSDRWTARLRNGLPQTPADVVEATELLREARAELEMGDPWRAQIVCTLGLLLATRSLMDGGSNSHDSPERDEAIEYLAEGVTSPDLVPSALEFALLYLAMLLIFRAIPPGMTGLGADLQGTDGLGRVDMRAAPAAMEWLTNASASPRSEDLDAATAHLERLLALKPVNEQIYQLAPLLLTQATMIRALFGGGLAGLLGVMKNLSHMWSPGFDAGGAGMNPSGFNNLDSFRTLISGLTLPELTAGPEQDAPSR